MSRQKGARLWLEPAAHTTDGKLRRAANWVIRDGSCKIRTGCTQDQRNKAERKLAEHIGGKYAVPTERNRHPSKVLILDVLNLYQNEIAPDCARPKEVAQRIESLSDWWSFRRDENGVKTSTPLYLSDVNGKRCRDYVKWRTAQQRRSAKPGNTGRPARPITEAMARRELEDLRAAVNYHRQEGYCSEIIGVVLPPKPPRREAWLTRSEAARLLWAAWRARQVMRDEKTSRAVGRHVARFILVGLYSGTRSAAICGASFQPAIGRGYVDVDRGVFHRRAKGAAKETNKRQPPVPISDRLLAHLRRWKRLGGTDAGQRLGIGVHAVVEWNGEAIKSVKKSFAAAAKAAGLPTEGPDKITPHVLRHTAATWMMRNGVNTWKAAGFLGISEKVLIETYGHHHPDIQLGAAEELATGHRALGRNRRG
jgi:integrase